MEIWDKVAAATEVGRATLSYDRIAQAGVAIADAEGVEAVSMRKVAAALGSGTMSLYRYVASRDELVDLMTDHVRGEIPLPPRTGRWRTDLAAGARRFRTAALAHPWWPACVTGRNSLGPNTVQTTEAGLAALDGHDLHIDRMIDVLTVVQSFVLGHAAQETAEEDERRRTGLSEDQWRRRMAPRVNQLLESPDHPMMARLVREAEDFVEPDAAFDRRLELVLDGLAAVVEPGDGAPGER
jgi:AcrR family transcriptional regulator